MRNTGIVEGSRFQTDDLKMTAYTRESRIGESSHGGPVAEFLDDFPTVEKALAIGVLEHMKQLVITAR
jgi:hypothetical protein